MNFITAVILILLSVCVMFSSQKANFGGRYTRDIGDDYAIVYPQRVHSDGSFASYSLMQFYDWPPVTAGRTRRLDDTSILRVYYLLLVGRHLYLLELEPNIVFMAPALVIELPGVRLNETTLRRPSSRQCHYIGWARGRPSVRAALSLCDGMVGYVRTPDGTLHFIEPVSDAVAEEEGRLKHVVYRSTDEMAAGVVTAAQGGVGFCGVQGDWKDAWAHRFEYELSIDPSYNGKREAAAENGARYIELVVVVDKHFISYHETGKRDPEQYLLTIMNMVSDFYHDESIGHLINVNIVRIVYLNKEYEEFDVQISPNAITTLKSFCEWQLKINPNIDHPNHHDMGLLITKYDICSDPSGGASCGLLGLANVAQACNPKSSCCITEDHGLSLGITVAHEMGHVLGIHHDAQEPVTCPAQDPATGSNYIMSPTVGSNTIKWSNCSREMITQFFEYGLGNCLLDEPADHEWKLPEMPAGVVYDADKQCSLLYNIETKACNFGMASFCQKLVCRKNNSCWTNHQPPAEGTRCANNKWCSNNKCVSMGTRSTAVNGGWSEWGSVSACSRTCGGGVAKIERNCNNPPPANRGKYCSGGRRRYQLCNTQPCPDGQRTFYEVQCTEKNNVTFSGKLHTWKPYKAGAKEKPCALVCINEKYTYSTLSPRLKDGTPCKDGTKNRCVAGTCRAVGCDWVLDSSAVEDNCGMCAGDGTSCSLVEKLYNATSGTGYVKVDVIPKGSTNIHVAEKEPSYNIISVADESGSFFLNKQYHEDTNGEYNFGGVKGVYNHPVQDKEDLVIKGPTTMNLILYYVWFGRRYANPGLEYSYYAAASPAPRSHSVESGSLSSTKYSWELVDWSDCSANCGGGSQESVPACVEQSSGKVDGKFCEGISSPSITSRVCNQRSCEASWRVGPWRECCRSREDKGYQVRSLACLREPQKPGGELVYANESMCTKNPPNTIQKCKNPKYCQRFRRYSDLVKAAVTKASKKGVAVGANRKSAINKKIVEDGHQSDVGLNDYTEVDYDIGSPLSWRKLDNRYQALLQRPPMSSSGTADHGRHPHSSGYVAVVEDGGTRSEDTAPLSKQEKLPREVPSFDGGSWNEESGQQQQTQYRSSYWDEEPGAAVAGDDDGSRCGEDAEPGARGSPSREGYPRNGRASKPNVILDRAPAPFLMEVPLVRKEHELRLSERTKEEMGDKVPELGHVEMLVPDSSRARNYTDEAAVRKMNELRPPGA